MTAKRKGVAAMWALVVLAVVSIFSAVAISQFGMARRQIDTHRNRIEAEWLARSGYEMAVAQILAGPKDYTGETAAPIPKSEIKISVKKDPQQNDVFQIESVARYPADEKSAIVRTVRCSIKRVDGSNGARIEFVSGPAEPEKK